MLSMHVQVNTVYHMSLSNNAKYDVQVVCDNCF